MVCTANLRTHSLARYSAPSILSTSRFSLPIFEIKSELPAEGGRNHPTPVHMSLGAHVAPLCYDQLQGDRVLTILYETNFRCVATSLHRVWVSKNWMITYFTKSGMRPVFRASGSQTWIRRNMVTNST